MVHEAASLTEDISFPGLNLVALMPAGVMIAVARPAVVVAAVAETVADETAAAETAADAAAVRVPVPAVLVPSPAPVLGPEPELELVVPIAYVGSAEIALGPLQACVLEPENAVRHVPEQTPNVPVLEKTAQVAVSIPVAGLLVEAEQQELQPRFLNPGNWHFDLSAKPPAAVRLHFQQRQ